jgi:hypothetical protein
LPHLETMLQTIKDPCRIRRFSKEVTTSLYILIGKGSLSNRKSTSKKEVNNKIHITCSDLYRKSFSNFDSPKSVHKQIPLDFSDKVSAWPTIGFGVMLNSVKLDSGKVYSKNWTLPFLDRISYRTLDIDKYLRRGQSATSTGNFNKLSKQEI